MTLPTSDPGFSDAVIAEASCAAPSGPIAVLAKMSRRIRCGPVGDVSIRATAAAPNGPKLLRLKSSDVILIANGQRSVASSLNADAPGSSVAPKLRADRHLQHFEPTYKSTCEVQTCKLNNNQIWIKPSLHLTSRVVANHDVRYDGHGTVINAVARELDAQETACVAYAHEEGAELGSTKLVACRWRG